MSTNVPPQDRDPGGPEPPEDEVLAAELVLGLLGGEPRRAAQARVGSDPQFAARVDGWEERLAPWLDEFEAIATPARLWPQIRQRLGWQVESPGERGWWQSLTLWRTAAALAAIAAFGLWVTRAPEPLAPPVAVQPAGPVTTLAHDDGSAGWLASVDRARGTVLIVPVPSAADAQGRVPELWLIPAGQAPRSLGRISVDKSGTVAVPADARVGLVAGSVLAITLEPASGIPHAAPSGPIIAKGAIQS